MTITNLKRTPMEYMYMAHVNFRPVDNGRLVYSARCTPSDVRVRRSIPSHVKPPAGFAEFLDELAQDPAQANVLKPGMAFDPEVVFFIDYRADGDGWAHTMQVHPDGSADYIRHKPARTRQGRALDLPHPRPGRPRHGAPPADRRARRLQRRKSQGQCQGPRPRRHLPLRNGMWRPHGESATDG